HISLFSVTCQPPTSTLFPYTTLFRSAELPISVVHRFAERVRQLYLISVAEAFHQARLEGVIRGPSIGHPIVDAAPRRVTPRRARDRKSTRLNSSHVAISYAVFCLKKK